MGDEIKGEGQLVRERRCLNATMYGGYGQTESRMLTWVCVQDEGIAGSLDSGKITRGRVDGDVSVLGEKSTFSH